MTSMDIKPSDVSPMFPSAFIGNITRNLPYVLDAFNVGGLDRTMLLMALATIRAECCSFTPEREGISRFNTTAGGQPFDLYDNRADLGNTGSPDGERFRGRGYIQLTGRFNYRKYGAELGLPLEDKPEYAADQHVAATILVAFLRDHETLIRKSLAIGDFGGARRAVNGGTHGLEAFTEAWVQGWKSLPK
jgi:putative chitinase